MKTALLETALVAALVGAGSAGTITLLLNSGAAGERGRAPEASDAPLASMESEPAKALDGDLRARIDELRVANRTLIARVEALESRAVLSARVPAEVAPQEEPTSPILAEHGAAAEEALPAPFLQSEVEVALGRIRADERAEEERLRLERQALRIEERLSRLTDDLGLNQRQVGEMRTFLAEREVRQDELRELRERDGDRDSYREARELLNEENEATLARILTPTQLEGYLAREDDRGNRDRGRGRDDRGRRGERDG